MYIYIYTYIYIYQHIYQRISAFKITIQNYQPHMGPFKSGGISRPHDVVKTANHINHIVFLFNLWISLEKPWDNQTPGPLNNDNPSGARTTPRQSPRSCAAARASGEYNDRIYSMGFMVQLLKVYKWKGHNHLIYSPVVCCLNVHIRCQMLYLQQCCNVRTRM